MINALKIRKGGRQMRKQDTFIEVDEAMELLGVGRSKAYAILRQCNAELAAMGLMTFRGKCPRRYLYKKIYGLDEAYHPSEDLDKVPEQLQKEKS